jgi:hypothetical protein
MLWGCESEFKWPVDPDPKMRWGPSRKKKVMFSLESLKLFPELRSPFVLQKLKRKYIAFFFT